MKGAINGRKAIFVLKVPVTPNFRPFFEAFKGDALLLEVFGRDKAREARAQNAGFVEH